VLDRDYFSVAENELQDITSVLTVVAGKIVHAAEILNLFRPRYQPTSPSWSPVATYGGYQSRRKSAATSSAAERRYHYAAMCSCTSGCGVHGHDHGFAAQTSAPASDAGMFWGRWGVVLYLRRCGDSRACVTGPCVLARQALGWLLPSRACPPCQLPAWNRRSRCGAAGGSSRLHLRLIDSFEQKLRRANPDLIMRNVHCCERGIETVDKRHIV